MLAPDPCRCVLARIPSSPPPKITKQLCGGKACFGGKFGGKICGKICASNGDPELSLINGGDGVFLFFIIIIVSSPFAGAFGAFCADFGALVGVKNGGGG
ncbi:hypothetical protein ACLKA6_009438, partial [Drosophila palustris]